MWRVSFCPFLLSSWHKGPRLLPNPPERRAEQYVAHRIPATPEPSATRANARASDHAIARASADIFKHRPHQKILIARIGSRLRANALHTSFEGHGREGIQLERDIFPQPHEREIRFRHAYLRGHGV